jgi:hypothetical protein
MQRVASGNLYRRREDGLCVTKAESLEFCFALYDRSKFPRGNTKGTTMPSENRIPQGNRRTRIV